MVHPDIKPNMVNPGKSQEKYISDLEDTIKKQKKEIDNLLKVINYMNQPKNFNA
jgi:mRNA-degrading endonuclease YafQ of YafQ-DinJ toxin-antitoxin module